MTSSFTLNDDWTLRFLQPAEQGFLAGALHEFPLILLLLKIVDMLAVVGHVYVGMNIQHFHYRSTSSSYVYQPSTQPRKFDHGAHEPEVNMSLLRSCVHAVKTTNDKQIRS
jgi:hypothetical protein